MIRRTQKAFARHRRAAARAIVDRLEPWARAPRLEPQPQPQPEPQPTATPLPDPLVWTLPDRRLHRVLPPIAELVRTHHGDRPLRDVVRDLFGDEDSVQTEHLRALSEAELRAFVDADRAPLPIPEDRALYFGEQHVSYWLNGLGDYLFLNALVASCGFERDAPLRMLDFGCSSGRVLRHFLANAPEARVHGCDLWANAVRFMNAHLPPRGVYFQNSVVPSLPLPDASLDLVFCGSVFTHMDEFEEAWLLELRRVLRPGGVAFVTIHTERTWRGLRDPDDPIRRHLTAHPYRSLEADETPIPPAWLSGEMPSERVVLRYVPSPLHHLHTFYATDYVRARWARFFEVRAIVERAHGTRQDGVVLVR